MLQAGPYHLVSLLKYLWNVTSWAVSSGQLIKVPLKCYKLDRIIWSDYLSTFEILQAGPYHLVSLLKYLWNVTSWAVSSGQLIKVPLKCYKLDRIIWSDYLSTFEILQAGPYHLVSWKQHMRSQLLFFAVHCNTFVLSLKFGCECFFWTKQWNFVSPL